MTATHFIAHDDNAIYGIGTTADGAIADALNQEPSTTGLKAQPCTQALRAAVLAHGGCLAWATVDGVACTRADALEALADHAPDLLALAEAVRDLAPAIRTLAHPTSDHPHAVAARRVLAILEGK